MKKIFRFCLLSVLSFCIALFISSQRTLAETAAKSSCVTEKCHAGMGKDKFVHGPTAVGDCGVCHRETAKHKFAPIKDVGALCYACHDKVDSKKAVHKPVKDGTCTKCHSPHQSSNKYMLLGAGAQLCFKCHAKSIAEGKFQHGPVAVGDCTMCHSPHQSEFPKLLQAQANGVCFTCHMDKQDEIAKKKAVHTPVKEKCVACHLPHAANFAPLLKNEPTKALCLDCHKARKDQLAMVKVPHNALGLEKGCLECHDAHATDFPKQLVREPMDLCLNCHNKDYKSASGTVGNIKLVIDSGKIKHGPIREKDCSACHDPHGSDFFRILRNYFPPVFYAPFNVKNYGLCFGCHQQTLVLDSKTTTLTNFRNGNENLHFLHVNKAEKGRTCRACHEGHATNNPNHVRDSVPFGGWKIPINYKKNPDGGSCAPGCHAPFAYGRTKAVPYR